MFSLNRRGTAVSLRIGRTRRLLRHGWSRLGWFPRVATGPDRLVTTAFYGDARCLDAYSDRGPRVRYER